MTVETIRAAVAARSAEILGSLLVQAGITHHKKSWRACVCSWCVMKREATAVIGHIPPTYSGPGVLVGDRRHLWRNIKRAEYRKTLAALEQA